MTEELTPVGMNRRDMLKRSAVVGGALVWAAPAVQTFAPKAFAQTGSPLSGYSYAAFIVKCTEGDTVHFYRVKGNLNEDTGEFLLEEEPGTLPFCEDEYPLFWEAYEAAAKTGGVGIKFAVSSSQVGTNVTFMVSNLTSHCEVEVNQDTGGVYGVMFEATNCSQQVALGDTYITFDESLTDPNK